MIPKLNGILETSLYVRDLERSIRFYSEIFGFKVVHNFGRGCAMKTGDRQVLLLFVKEQSRDVEFPHDGSGELHLAFAVNAALLSAWERWLNDRGIRIEGRQRWQLGGQSIYFRDPDRHLLELATPGTWSIY